MPGYITCAPQRISHTVSAQPELSPNPWERPNYGAKPRLAPIVNTSDPITPKEQLDVQKVLGTPLYCARAIDSTLLSAISALLTKQTHETRKTLVNLSQLMD
jgi:hypothetical protein